MSINRKNSKFQNYYSGGLSELVSSPTVLTYSFLKNWFTGKGSIGKAMKILGLPYADIDLPVLDLIDGNLVVDLSSEEETLYSRTIFKYKRQIDIDKTPRLAVDLGKIISPICVFNTLGMLIVQSGWIADPKNLAARTEKLLETMPQEIKKEDIDQIDELLKDKIWPVVIAVGLLNEFYNQLITKEAGENLAIVNRYISSQVAKDDWFFRSIARQEEVKKHKLDFTAYIEEYGIRADKDYELASPRWHEITDVVKERINKNPTKNNGQNIILDVSKKLKTIIDASIKLQLIRSEAKRKALFYINQLRKKILEKTKHLSDISQFTREEIINGQLQRGRKPAVLKNKQTAKSQYLLSEGRGISISQGTASGIALNIVSCAGEIPKGTIAIFPNASPEFAIQYSRCEGMIFLKGGQTSHGAIVAREFGIPALVDHKAEGIADGTTIELNGSTGEWRIIFS